MYWVYILNNYLKRDYISVTINIEERMKEHREEMRNAGVTSEHLEIVYQEYHTNAISALAREKALKGLSSIKLHKFLNAQTEDVVRSS